MILLSTALKSRFESFCLIPIKNMWWYMMVNNNTLATPFINLWMNVINLKMVDFFNKV